MMEQKEYSASRFDASTAANCNLQYLVGGKSTERLLSTCILTARFQYRDMTELKSLQQRRTTPNNCENSG